MATKYFQSFVFLSCQTLHDISTLVHCQNGWFAER